MANVKITDLTEDATPADGDWVETVDISAGASKKVTRTNFFLNPPLGAGSVDPEDLVSGTGTDWAWQTWSPTYANLTIGNGTVVAKYIQVGKTVHGRWEFTLGTTSAISTGPTFTLPVTAASSANLKELIGLVWFDDAGVGNSVGMLRLASSTTAEPLSLVASGTYLTAGSVTSTVPGALGNGDMMTATFTYEAA